MLHQVSSAVPVPLMPRARTAALIGALGVATRTHILIIGDDTLDLVCALIRAGCPGVSAMHSHDRLAGATETVIVAHGSRAADMVSAIEHAAHVLTPAGQVFIQIDAPATDPLVRVIVRRLRFRGFDAIRSADCVAGVVVRATLPAFGPLHAIPQGARA